VLLLDIVVILAFARLLAALARRLGQPAVIGEILAGILLGPTLLGDLFGDGLFPTDVRPALQALADVGLVLFMFVVGMELDQKLIRGKERVAAGVALGTTLVPFGLGAVLALTLADEHGGGKRLAFVLFLATAMAVTAFPVMARILTDRGMHRTQLGGIALASAGVADVMAWTMLAIVVALAGSGENGQWQVVLAVPFAVLMFTVVRPLLRRLIPSFERAGRVTPGLLGVVLIGLMASAWATEWMHVHFIFGAFLFGAVMPRQGAERMNHEILGRLEHLAVLLLLPMFFVVAGLSVDLSKLDVSGIGTLGAILVVAIGGTLGGTYLGARLQHMPKRESAAIATLMNTRGLTELVILTVGLQKGVLDNTLYSLMVVMALVTTATTGPLLRWIYPQRLVDRDIAEAERLALGADDTYQVVAVVPDPATGGPVTDLARALVGGVRPAEVVLAHLQPYPDSRLDVGTGLSSEVADMADVLHELEPLAARARSEEVPSRVVSQFARDVAGELPDLVASADATVEVVVVSAATPGYDALRARTAGRLVTVLADPSTTGTGPVAAHYDGVEDSVAAETGLRLALALDRTLLLAGRRGAGLAERLSALGVDVRSDSAVADGALVVAADSDEAGEGVGPVHVKGAHLLVRAERDAAEVDWEAAVEALRVGVPAEPSASGRT
jgi:Kef-type K+ transport system membrane component KefB